MGATDDTDDARGQASGRGIYEASNHARDQWARRGGRPGANLLAVWREAHPVDYPSAQGEAYARFHEPSGLVLIARWGRLVTCVELSDRPTDEQRHVRKQVSD